MDKQDKKAVWEILTEKVEQYDEMGFPALDGEYDIDGYPLPILKVAHTKILEG